ncbi:murein hydrolase effector protein LrgB [Shewanella sp. Choline-02u-19]|uniref:LrgB family protein n=1 Tax=unclassified Shewanella TaxID=196818 RepID=UPI000C335136|nr:MULTISPECIES: LrgB family protein [unclassified Shewanella]PKG55937.1 murein hydrolase effector protein LrgB [Shewanella sp. GutDb-MelDb]PKG76602.1 murein hydrolase effector protein LrgB [Shewanella sp. GutCb]PKH56234.1 murein hydrolase effector protein LrgB [Shewanella sp. Bg11-22]PKI28696.1 murein hydrolase effector protein LrgB [Shewanella sp. Choline-02u-19]
MTPSLWGVFCFVLTLFGYYSSKALYRRHKKVWFAPIVIAPLIILFVVITLNIPLADYFKYTHWLAALLAPATIAFAVPIYRERALIKQYPITLSVGVLVGLLLGIGSSWLVGYFTSMPAELSNSLMVRSVSTPFAIVATSSFGGVPELTAMLVLITGVMGMLICEPLFKVAKIRSSVAKGVALGASAHGAGAAKASEIGRQEGVIASLTMIFTGIAMVIMAPAFAYIIN